MDGSRYFAYPYSLSPLPETYKHGLIAPGLMGTLSAASCVAMLLFVMYRFLTWRSHFKTFIGYNQYVVLIINLLLADMLQGISFIFSFHWIAKDGIFAPSSQCFSQGFILNLGDLASGFFIFGIALHTFYGAVKGRHAKHTTFSAYIVSAWFLALLLTALGPMIHRDDYFVRAGAWCWANTDYESERLALHYIWIFLVQFGIVVLYALIFLHLKRSITYILPSSESSTHAKVDRAAKLMVMFPIAYILFTLPLSAGRMWTTAHHGASLSEGYSLVAGSMIGSCGIVDCLLYTLTRRSILSQSKQGSTVTGSTGASRGSYHLSKLGSTGGASVGITQTRTVTVTGDRLSIISADDDNISDLGSVSRSTTGGVGGVVDFRASHVYAISPLGSEERIVTPGIAGLDPRKGGQTVEITAIPTPPPMPALGGESDERLRSREDSAAVVTRGRPETPPYGVRQALGFLSSKKSQSRGSG